jgi:chromosomal replication initiator protein
MELTFDQQQIGDRETFHRYLRALRGRVGDAKYRSWFLDLGLAERTNKCVTFSTATQAKRDMLDHRFMPILAETWRQTVGPIDKIRLTVRDAMRKHASKIDAQEERRARSAFEPALLRAQSDKESSQEPLGGICAELDPRRTFATFAVGESNHIAWAAAQRALADKSERELIYFYGESGVGKTHLESAICNEYGKNEAAGSFIYMTYRNMINVCVKAALSNATSALHKAFLANSLLVFDDIHLLEGKDRTQEELLVVIDAALDSGKQVVLAGDSPPAKLAEAGMNKRLADRLAGGLCAPIHEADDALRLDILKKRVRRSDAKCLIGDDVLEFIARTFNKSTRETTGALNQLLLMYSQEEITVALDEAKSILKSRLEERRKPATLEDAIAAGAEAFSLKLEDMTARAQPQRIVRARHAVVYCAREVLKESFPRIGKALRRDHTTVMSSYRRAQALMERDNAFQAGVRRIREAIGG